MGAIKPLREGNASGIKPATVALKVDGAARNQVNEVEARMSAALVCAMTRHTAYDGKSLGIISLVGDDQALRIETLIRHRLDPIEFDARRIVCGNPAQFQGDERDVMILSMIDSPSGNGPLALREAGAFDMFKKRYNVAASRAKDQMWVVHSLEPGIDLKANDLRRRLIEHASDPSALMRELEAKSHAVESEFERRVMEKLVQAGYRVTPQWKVGYYRIDLVVEGGGKRVAVECDGDRYHPLEKLSEDMARQAILERLGWKFIRLRGSAFWRDPEGEMRSVFAQLTALGIPAEGCLTTPEPEINTGTRDEIIALAQELLTSWSDEAEPDAEPAPIFRRKRQTTNPASSQTRADTPTASQVISADTPSEEHEVKPDHIPDAAAPNDADVDEVESNPTPDHANDNVRVENDRDTPGLRDAILAACADGLRHDRETLLREVSTKLGHKRLGRKIRASITRAIGAQVRAGRLQGDSVQIWLASETTALVVGNGSPEIDFTVQAELNHLEQELADKELELATAQAEVAHFSRRYYATVGAKYAELDELRAKVAAVRARHQPQDAEAQNLAEEAKRRADQSQAEADANAGPLPEQPQFVPSADLKKLYRQIAQKVHPDRAANDEDREWRNLLMSEANVAYQDGDETRLRAVLERWLVGMPKQVLLSLAELLRRTRDRLTDIELQLNALYGSGPYELMLRVGVAEAVGRDLLDEMVRELEQQIREAREELAQLKD
jgi:very-short-patch-repair endonuclease